MSSVSNSYNDSYNQQINDNRRSNIDRTNNSCGWQITDDGHESVSGDGDTSRCGQIITKNSGCTGADNNDGNDDSGGVQRRRWWK